MDNTKPKPPKWTVLCLLAGAICAFIAAGYAFSKNGETALIFGVTALLLYIVAFVGLILHKKNTKH